VLSVRRRTSTWAIVGNSSKRQAPWSWRFEGVACATKATTPTPILWWQAGGKISAACARRYGAVRRPASLGTFRSCAASRLSAAQAFNKSASPIQIVAVKPSRDEDGRDRLASVEQFSQALLLVLAIQPLEVGEVLRHIDRVCNRRLGHKASKSTATPGTTLHSSCKVVGDGMAFRKGERAK
jgi:hypothetical protein